MTDTETIHQFAVQNMLAEKYLLSELKGADLEDFERHMFECDTCFNQVKAGRAFIANMSGEPPRRSRGSMQWWRRLLEFLRRHTGSIYGAQSLVLFLQLGPVPSPPPRMSSPFLEGVGVGVSLALAVAAICVFASAVYARHWHGGKKP